MIPALIVIFAVILITVAAYLFSIYPGRIRNGIISPLKNTYIAHRGLFNKTDTPENSLPAFKAAVDNGYAIELDVQLSADGHLVVFHDEDLSRMCKIPKKVSECTFSELLSYSLLSTEERIPLFSDVLSVISGRVPLLIEVKPTNDVSATVKSLDKALEGYCGYYAVQSFHPAPVIYFKKHHPNIPRGILSTNYKKNKMGPSPFIGFIMTNLLLNFIIRPDFVAYNHKYMDEISLRTVKKLYKIPCVAWTVRNKKDLKKAKKFFCSIIFDSFIPE